MSGVRDPVSRFLSVFGGKLLTTLVAVLSTPVIVRLLGPGGYGDYAVLLSVFSLYMIPVSAGVTEGVQKFVAERRDLPHWRARVVRFYLLLAGGFAVVGAVLLVAFTAAGGARWLFGAGVSRYFYLLAAFVVVAQFREVSYRVVLGSGLEHVSEPLLVAKKLLIVGVGIALVFAGYGVAGMLVGHVVASAFVAVASGYVVVRQVSVRAMAARLPDSFPYRELLSFNVANVLLVLLVMSLFHVDIVMVRSLVGAEETGYYKAALALAEYLWFVPIALQTLLLHSTATLWSEGRDGAVTDVAARITRYTALLVVLMAVGLATLADRFVPLYYGAPFAVATLPLLLLLPGTVGFALARPIQAIGQGSGQMRTLLVAAGGAAAVNLALNTLLVPRYGMVGAAVATSVSYGSMFGLLVWAARRIGFDPLADFRPLRLAATALVAAPVILATDALLTNDVVALLVVPPVGFVVYVAAALATGALDGAELVALAGRLPDPVGAAVEAAGERW